MRTTHRLLFTVALVGLVTGCPFGKKLSLLQHQHDLDCPNHLEAYCGGWDVHSTSYTPANEHIEKSENFVIGRKNLGGGNEQLALFPRGQLLIRWNPPNGRVDLKEITNANNDVLCLVGRVNINTHSGGHNWHGIIVTTQDQTLTPQVGNEHAVEMCMTVQSGGGWPADCACDVAATDPRQHGGRAHAYD